MNLTDKQKLNQRMSLSLEDKIQLSKQRIKDWYNHWDGDVYVAFSGGWDSTVLLHLVRSIYPDVVGVFSDTGLERPEIKEFVKTVPNVVRVRPKKHFKQVIEDCGYPLISKQTAYKIKILQLGDIPKNHNTYNLYLTGINSKGEESKGWKLSEKWKYLVDSDIKISDECCNHLKKEPLHTYEKETGNKPFIGSMVEEGGFRERLTKCNVYDKYKEKSYPLLFWTKDDINNYTKMFDLDICSAYYDRVVDDNGTEVACAKTPDHFTSYLESLTFTSEYGGIKMYKDSNGESYSLIPAEERTGCMFCMFGVHLEKGANRFQKMAITHPRHWDTCINKIGLKKPLDLINVKYIPE